jgi:hypothetical protein
VTILITYFHCIFIGTLNWVVLPSLVTSLMKERLCLLRQHLLGIKFDRRIKEECVKLKVGRTSDTNVTHHMKNCSAFFRRLFQVNMQGTRNLSFFHRTKSQYVQKFAFTVRISGNPSSKYLNSDYWFAGINMARNSAVRKPQQKQYRA